MVCYCNFSCEMKNNKRNQGSILIEDFERLRKSVNLSSEHTKRQIETITNTVSIGGIGGIISLFLALGVSYVLKIFVYWIPSSFILMYLWALSSYKSTRKTLKEEEIDESLKIYQKISPNVFEHTAGCFIKNLSSLIYSTIIIFIVSFFVTLSIINNWIELEKGFPYLYPLVTCLLYLPAPFFMENFLNFLQKRQYKIFLDKLIEIRADPNKKRAFTITIAKILFILIYALLLMFLPLISIWYLLPLIEDWLLLLMVFIMQVVLIVLFSSYFSGIVVKKELGNAITNYSDIDNQLSYMILEEKKDMKQYQLLKRLYYTAKPYDFKIDDSFKIVNFYLLLPNRVYMKEISLEDNI